MIFSVPLMGGTHGHVFRWERPLDPLGRGGNPGVPQDCEELGKFMGDLLSQRRYRWISRKKAIYCGSDYFQVY